MKISLQLAFFVITLIAVGIVFIQQQYKLTSLSEQLAITQRDVTVNVTSETSSFRWSFKQKELLDCGEWLANESNYPFSISDVRRTADEIIELLNEKSEVKNLFGWQYGSVLTTQIAPGYGQSQPSWVYVVEFTAATDGVKFGNWEEPTVSLMILMNGSCHVSDDSWNVEIVRSLIRHKNHNG